MMNGRKTLLVFHSSFIIHHLFSGRGRETNERQADAEDSLLLAVDGDVPGDVQHPVLVFAHLQGRGLAEVLLRHGEEEEDRRVPTAAGLLAQVVQLLWLKR